MRESRVPVKVNKLLRRSCLLIAKSFSAHFQVQFLAESNQIMVVAFQSVQLAQASFLQKNQMLQNVF